MLQGRSRSLTTASSQRRIVSRSGVSRRNAALVVIHPGQIDEGVVALGMVLTEKSAGLLEIEHRLEATGRVGQATGIVGGFFRR